MKIYKSVALDLTIYHSVLSIGDDAFSSCSDLTSITIPDSVTRIGNDAFYKCDSLKSVIIGNSVLSIGDGAFRKCSSLTSATIGNSVTSIGQTAFSGCSGLTSITIPNSVTNIGASAFFGCSGLTNITIPYSVKTISLCAFYGCGKLTSITIPDSVTSIEKEAFENCSSLTRATFGNSVTSIGEMAFSGCSGLTSITIPNSVTSIGDGAFSDCSKLTSITIPDSITSIGSGAFSDTAYYKNSNNWVNNVLYIGKHLIKSDEHLSGEYIIKPGTKTIQGDAFWSCRDLTSITIPDSVSNICRFAFYDCRKLTSITIPDSVTSIGASAFEGCSRLTSVTINNKYCEIYDHSYTIYSSATIYGYTGSTAQAYAKKYGRTFVALDAPSDTTKPIGSISSTNNVAASQTATLTLGDDKGVAGYYWGTNSNYSSNTYTTASAGSITKTVSNSGTYYLTVKDTSGNISDTVSVTYYKTTLNANSGSVSPASVLTKSGNSFTFPTPTRSGYTYQGWNTSSTATSGVKTLSPNSNTTYYAVWKSGSTKNPFQWGKDNWSFYNSSYNGDFSDSTYRSQINSTYQNVLKNNLTNSEYQCVFKGGSYYDSWLDEEWGGSCYGMSSTVLLSKAGLLPYSSYKSNANCLYQLNSPASVGINSPSSTANVSSLITYYQMLQVKDVIQQQYRSVPQKSNKENITNLISLLDKNDTVLIGFQKSGWGGHAILAYGYEYGSYSKNGVTYQGRIKICDPNHSVSNDDNYYIYFNTSSYNWTIPAYSSYGINSTKGATFNYIGANNNEINKGGYLSSSSNATTDNYIARIDAKEISNNRSITKVVNNNGAYANHSSAPGEIVEDYSYVLGDKDKGTIGYNLYDADSAYKVMQEDATDLALAIDYEKCMLSGSSKSGESVVFDDEGYVSLTSESADYSVGMTFDENYPTDWFAIEVTGENANEVELEKESNGWVLEADNLQNVTVNTNNKTDEACASFSTEYDSVLIYEINKNTIGVSVDTDNNGSYETRINTTKSVGSTTVSLAQSIVYYDGSAKEPTATVKDGDKTLVKNRDYIVIYSNNTNIGVGTATIVGMGDYSGTKELKFNIVCNHKMQAKVVAPKATKVGYTEYKCSTCGEWKKDAKGNVVKDSFTSPTGKPAGFKCASRTAKAMKFTWTKTSGVSGYQIQLLNSAGKAVATKTTTGNTYSFAALTAAHAYKARVRFYIKAADGNNYYGAWSTITSPTLPKETKVSSLTAAKKAFTAKWGKVSGVTGYQLQYSVNAKFSKATTKTVKGATKVKLTVKSLKGGTKYFVRVRTYKTVGGKNYYSTWSATKSGRTK